MAPPGWPFWLGGRRKGGKGERGGGIILYSDSELALPIRAKGHPVACLFVTMVIKKHTKAKMHKNGLGQFLLPEIILIASI